MEMYKIIIWSLYVGICLALLYSYYVKHLIGSVVRYLIEHECFSKENAKSLSSFKHLSRLICNFVLRENSEIYETVSVCEEGGEKLYFIQEEKAEKAKKRYKGDIKLMQIIFGAAVLLVAALIISLYYNDIMKFITKGL